MKAYLIAIIDDSATQLLQLRRQLEQMGFEVESSSSGSDALQSIKKNRPDLVISDIVMPDMDGYTLCRRIKDSWPEIPVILLTVLSDEEDVIRGLECRADSFLTKPCRAEMLASRIERLVAVRKKPADTDGSGEAVDVSFAGKEYRITAGRRQVIELLLSTYENAVQKNMELAETNRSLEKTRAALSDLNTHLEDEVRERTERISHLNRIIQAIRDVDKLIVRETDRSRLLEQTCRLLIATRGFFHAWIVLLDEAGGLLESAQAGTESEFRKVLENIRIGKFPDCMKRVLDEKRIVAFEDYSQCRECPLAGKNPNRGALAGPLIHNGRLFGVLEVSLPTEFALDSEEQSLFEEVAGDVAFALSRMELEVGNRETSARLAESETRFKAVFDHARDGILVTELESRRFVLANRRMCEMLDLTEEEVLRIRVDDIHPEEALPHVIEQLERQARGEISLAADLPVLRRDGGVFYADINSSVVQMSGREYLMGIFRDISERKEAEREKVRLLEETRERVKELACLYNIDELEKNGDLSLEAFHEKVSGVVPGGYRETANTACRIVFEDRTYSSRGFRETEWMQSADITVGDTVRGTLDVAYLGDMTEEQPDPFLPEELDLLRAVARRVGAYVDRKTAEDELRKSEEQFRGVVENMPVMLEALDGEGRLIVWNRECERVTGYPAAEMIGRPNALERLYPDKEQLAAVMKEWSERGDDFVDREIELTGKDGTKHIVSWTNIADRHPVPGWKTWAIGVDVTDRRNLEEQFRQSQKLEAVGRLAGGVAHDFNNMMTAVLGYSEYLLGIVEADGPVHRAVQEIQKAGNRAASLTDQLLAFSRKRMIEPEVVDLNRTINGILNMIRRLIGEDIRLEVRTGPDLGRVKVDSGQIDQVLLNLAVNARDAMPGGGILTIETLNVELDEAYARQHVAVRPGNFVMLAVTDTGGGMDSETQSHIFEPFFTTKEKGKGTGLGLATVYGIVKQCEGNIWVYSEPGKGTAFKIYLPRIDIELRPKNETELPVKSSPGTETILLVEDEEMVRDLARLVLQENGYTVLEADGGRKALDIVEQRAGPIDLLLTDVVMPEMSGRELADRIRAAGGDPKVIYMSGYTDNSIHHHGVLDEGIHFLQKPFTQIRLLQKVREVLNKA